MNKIFSELSKYFTADRIYDWGTTWGTSLFKIIIILILAKFVLAFGGKIIEKIFSTQLNSKVYFEERRAATLSVMLKNVLFYVVYFISIISILTVLKIPVTPILAGAGVVSLAVGFGAQSLVKDVITGFFIIFEDQYSVGEYITLNTNISGIVEDFGLRVTKLRAFSGELHIVPNGQITEVTNFNRGSLQAMVEVGIAYEEDVEKAQAVLEQVSAEVAKELADTIVEAPKVLGVVRFGEFDVVIRIVAQAKPLEQWNVERVLRKRIKEAFDREGIEIPYPRRVIVREGGLNEEI